MNSRSIAMRTHNLILFALIVIYSFSCTKDSDCEAKLVEFNADFRHDLGDLKMNRGDTAYVTLEIEGETVDQHGNAFSFDSVTNHFYPNLISIEANQENNLVGTPAVDGCFNVEMSVAREGPSVFGRRESLLPKKIKDSWILQVKLIPELSGQYLFRWSMNGPENSFFQNDPCLPIVRMNVNHSEDNGLSQLFEIDSSLADEPRLSENHAALFFVVR